MRGRNNEVFPDTCSMISESREMKMHDHDPKTLYSSRGHISVRKLPLDEKAKMQCSVSKWTDFEGPNKPKSSESVFYKHRQRTEKDAFVPPPAT